MPLFSKRDNEIRLKVEADVSEVGVVGRALDRAKKQAISFGKDATKYSGQFRGGLKALRGELSDTNKGFTLLRGTLSSLAGNVAAGAVFGLQDLTSQLVTIGIEADRARTRFLAFSDSLTEGRRLYQDYLDIANNLGVAFAPIIDLGTQFRAVGFEAEDATDLIRRLTIAAGGSAVAVDSIGRSLRQMRAGKVELEELNPIAEAGVPIFRLLSEQIGLTADEGEKLFDLIENRKLIFDDVVGAFRRFTEEGSKSQIASEETAQTISADIARLQNAFEQFGITVVDLFQDDISNAINSAGEALGIFEGFLTRLTSNPALGFLGRSGQRTELQRQVDSAFNLGPNSGNLFRDPLGILGTQGTTTEAATTNLLRRYDEIINLESEINRLQTEGGFLWRARVVDLQARLQLLQEAAAAQSVYLGLLKEGQVVSKETERVETEAERLRREALQREIYLNELLENKAEFNSQYAEFNDSWVENLKEVNSLLSGNNRIEERNVELGANIIQQQAKLREIEKERAEDIKEINLEFEQGFITQEQKLERIKEINEDAIIDNGLILQKIQEYVDLIGNSKVEQFFAEPLREAREHQEALLRAAREKEEIEVGSATIERLARELEFRSEIVTRLQQQAALEQVIANYSSERDFANRFQEESRTDTESTSFEAPLTPLQELIESGQLDKIERFVSTLTSGFRSIGDIVKVGFNRQLEIARNNLQKIRDQIKVQRLEQTSAYEDAIDEIESQTEIQIEAAAERLEANKNAFTQDYLNGLITAQQLTDAKKEEDRQYQITVERIRRENARQREREDQNRANGLDKLRRLELRYQNEVRQQEYELQLQAFNFDKAIKLARTFSDGIAGLLRAAADGEWGHFAALLGAGVLGGIALGIQSPPGKPPSIPGFHQGGYVREPTIAAIAERGPEYIFPEGLVDRMMEGRGEGNIVVNIYPEGDVISQDNLVKEVMEGVKEAVRDRRY